MKIATKRVRIEADGVDLIVKDPYQMLINLYKAISNKEQEEFLSDCINETDGRLFIDNDKISDAVLFESEHYHTLVFYRDEKGQTDIYRVLAKIKDLTQKNTKDGSWVGLSDEEIDGNLRLLKACFDSMNKPKEYI